MRRTREDSEEAYQAFLDADKECRNILDTWETQMMRPSETKLKLDKINLVLDRKRRTVSKEAVRRVLGYAHTRIISSFDGSTSGGRSEFKDKSRAKIFLENIYDEIRDDFYSLRRQYVEAIRTLTRKACDEQINSLHNRLNVLTETEHEVHRELTTQILDRIVLNDSDSEAPSTMPLIQRTVIHTLKEPYSGSAAYHNIRAFIAKDFDSLGFMAKAPLTAIASFSWVITAGVWPFMRRVRRLSS